MTTQGPQVVVLTRDCIGCGRVHASVVVDRDDTHDVDECPRCGREVNPVARVWCRPTSAGGQTASEAVRALFSQDRRPTRKRQEPRAPRPGVMEVVLRSDAGVTAEVLLESGHASSRAITVFQGDDPYAAWVACVCAHADVMQAFADRASRGDLPHLYDVSLTMAPPGMHVLISRLNLHGRDAWTLLSATFGDAYTEALP